MATIDLSYTVPDEKAADILDSVTNYLNYQENVTDPENPGEQIPNPQTRKSYLDARVLNYLKECYRAEKSKAGEVARLAAVEEANEVEMTVTP